MEKSEVGRLIRKFAAKVVVYSLWVTVYFLLVLRLLAGPLYRLFETSLVLHTFGSLGPIVVQGAVLEVVTSVGFGTLTHALKGNMEILMALVVQTGAAIGAQMGATTPCHSLV